MPEKPMPPSIPQAESAERKAKEAFERGVLERGEAAVPDARGKLPPGATHEIIGHDEAGKPILRRRRFEAF